MELKIDLKKLKESGLSVEEYVYLAIVNEGNNPDELLWNTTNFITSLEQNMWVKRVEGEVLLREKGRQLFQNAGVETQVDEVINYYKIKTDSPKVSNKTESNRKPIRGRLQEGYTVEDLKSVVDIKTKQWKGTSMDMYLRIETLFGQTKFQGYIREAGKVPKLGTINEMS